MKYLLDTNVVSEVRKPNGNTNVLAWFDDVDGNDLFLSVLVVGEIRNGIERLRRRDADRSVEYEVWLTALKRQYRERILRIDSEIAEAWGHINALRSLPVVDGLLAATALQHGLTMVTRNAKDFVDTGVNVLDPFADR